MKQVTINKLELVTAIGINMAQHREVFLEALDGYRKAQIDLLERDLARLKSGRSLENAIRYLPAPADHTRDYQRVLKMLAMHVADTIEMSQEDFARYVMDDWQWKRDFLITSANYSAKAKMMNDASGDYE